MPKRSHAPSRTHIPDPTRPGRTLCGRDATRAAVIDLARDSIEDATCTTCGRADDRRQIVLLREERAMGVCREEIRARTCAERSPFTGNQCGKTAGHAGAHEGGRGVALETWRD